MYLAFLGLALAAAVTAFLLVFDIYFCRMLLLVIYDANHEMVTYDFSKYKEIGWVAYTVYTKNDMDFYYDEMKVPECYRTYQTRPGTTTKLIILKNRITNKCYTIGGRIL